MPNRLLTSARWPLGVALTSWAYMWRTTPMHRRERAGTVAGDSPPPLPDGVSRARLQAPEDGVGPLFHRTYRVRIRDARTAPEELIARLGADPNEVAPGEFTHFHKERGAEDRMRAGDEFTVRMPGPWDGPIRVVEVTPTSFRFATLDGHLEAGQIEWRASTDDDGLLVFQITSWARSGDRLSAIMHDRVRMAKEVQLHMWTSVCERVAKCAGGRRTGGIDIETRRVEVG
jgi:hypothetical protein